MLNSGLNRSHLLGWRLILRESEAALIDNSCFKVVG